MASMKAGVLVFLVLCFGVLAVVAEVEREDPELQQCRHQCRVQQQLSERDKEECLQRCDDYHQHKHGHGQQEKQRVQECQSRCERHAHGQERQLCRFRCQRQQFTEPQNPSGQDEKLQECRQRCQTQKKEDKREMMECERECSEWFGRQRGGGKPDRYEEGEGDERHPFQEKSPYVFHEHQFVEKFRAEHGRVSVLEKFTEELLKGVENFRLGFLVAEPQTFLMPNHLDADGVFFVVQGTGTVTQIRDNKRESFHIRAGDVIKLEAGTPSYLINQDQQQQLFIAKLLSPVANPGEFEVFFGGGGGNPESFYSAFSMELLEAALQTRRDQLERLFGQQRQGVIIKASQEQIQALSKEREEGGVWPFHHTGESKGRRPFNLFDQEPSASNEFGKLFEAFPEDFRQLRDVNVAVSVANITQGAMMGPFYNSKATKFAFVTNGEGYFEMACPHLGKSQQFQRHETRGRHQEQQQPTRYHKVTSRLRRHTVFIVPAGHPVAIVASNNEGLQVVCFEVNAFNNERYPLAGKNNIISKMQREAKELAFSIPGREVDKIFKDENAEELFFPGPGQQRKSTWSII
uniref:Cupin type-1 domain-containing protein n=1 Tax=Kalanchoe fedtschenkoi TaxID=63787 RepID=A0A7N0SY97_KALFE